MEVSGQLHSAAVLPHSKIPKYPVDITFPVILNTLNSFTEFHTKLHRSHSPKVTNLCPRILLSSSSESKYEEFRIWGSHSGSYECYHLLLYSTVQSVSEPPFLRNIGSTNGLHGAISQKMATFKYEKVCALSFLLIIFNFKNNCDHLQSYTHLYYRISKFCMKNYVQQTTLP
jgi:hypothetical protein